MRPSGCGVQTAAGAAGTPVCQQGPSALRGAARKPSSALCTVRMCTLCRCSRLRLCGGARLGLHQRRLSAVQSSAGVVCVCAGHCRLPGECRAERAGRGRSRPAASHSRAWHSHEQPRSRGRSAVQAAGLGSQAGRGSQEACPGMPPVQGVGFSSPGVPTAPCSAGGARCDVCQAPPASHPGSSHARVLPEVRRHTAAIMAAPLNAGQHLLCCARAEDPGPAGGRPGRHERPAQQCGMAATTCRVCAEEPGSADRRPGSRAGRLAGTGGLSGSIGWCQNELCTALDRCVLNLCVCVCRGIWACWWAPWRQSWARGWRARPARRRSCCTPAPGWRRTALGPICRCCCSQCAGCACLVAARLHVAGRGEGEA